jgi:transcriptional regulator with XRE-family HTH domain
MGKYSIQKTPSECLLELAEKHRSVRKRAGWSQLELARRSGVSLGSLKRFESSGRISLESFLKLLLILGRIAEMEGVLHSREETGEIEKLFSNRIRK